MQHTPETRFVVLPFAGVMCGQILAGYYVRDLQDDTPRSDLYATVQEAEEYRSTVEGAQRAIDATERARSTFGHAPARVTGWC